MGASVKPHLMVEDDNTHNLSTSAVHMVEKNSTKQKRLNKETTQQDRLICL